MGQQRHLRQQDPSIPTIAPSGSILLGTKASSPGAARTITFVVSRRNRRLRRILTIALMVSRIGRQVGLSPRRSGAAGSMAKVAQTKVEDASRRPSHTIVMQDLPIGCRLVCCEEGMVLFEQG